MTLTDAQIGVFVSRVLHLGAGKRQEYIEQVDNLISTLKKKVDENSTLKIKGFKKTGSLVKGTVLKPKGDYGVDADIAVFLDAKESDKDDVESLHKIIRDLLDKAYPTKPSEDFKVQPRTVGIHFRVSGLDVDLVPVIPIESEPSYGWQPSALDGDPVKTSIQGQLDFISARKKADPRFRSLTRLIKKWRNEQELDFFRSFSIELILAHLIDTKGAALSLESGLKRFFLFIAQDKLESPICFPENGLVTSFPSDPVVILDPVNKANNVAFRLTKTEKAAIVAAATVAYETISTAIPKGGKGDTLDLWKEVFGRSFVIEED
jgi:hypothetical protein